MKKVTKIDYKKLFAFKPTNERRWHIFDKDTKISLCRKVSLPFIKLKDTEKINSKNEYIDGNDCKTCFKKAGLVKENKDRKEKSLGLKHLIIKGEKCQNQD